MHKVCTSCARHKKPSNNNLNNIQKEKDMSLKIVVLAKQVPDTRNVGKDAMTPEAQSTVPLCLPSLILKISTLLSRPCA